MCYLGKNLDTEDGIAYRNAEQFLKNLPGVTLESGLEEPSVIEENSVSGWVAFSEKEAGVPLLAEGM